MSWWLYPLGAGCILLGIFIGFLAGDWLNDYQLRGLDYNTLRLFK